MADAKPPTWSQIKKHLATLEAKELLNLMADLYKLNNDNKVFLASRLHLGQTEVLAEPYRRAIEREFNPSRGFPRLNLGAARKALNDFKKASADPVAVVDLMIYYVEQGVICTNQYGDIDAPFYNSLVSVYDEVATLLQQIGSIDLIEQFRPRLKRIVSNTSSVGWGFHDDLINIYYNEYPPE